LQKEKNIKDYNLNREVVLLLALGAIKDLHVKLGSPKVIVKHQNPSLMNIVVFSKVVPATSEESIAIAVIIHLQFIWRPATGCFPKNYLPKFKALHEFCELQRKALLFAALGTSEREERKEITEQ
jgi:hypothetical protein